MQEVSKYLYKIHDKTQDIDIFHQFLRLNYFDPKDRFKFIYTKSHLAFFLQTGGWISVYSKRYPETPIGVIAYRKIRINNNDTVAEVDFLSVLQSLRKMKIAQCLIQYIIDMLLKTEVKTCFFTGMEQRDFPLVAKKRIYLFVMNHKKLNDCQYIDPMPITKLQYKEDFLTYSNEINNEAKDTIHEVYRKEHFNSHECFIDFSIGNEVFFRFMKMEVRGSKQSLNSVMLHYATHEIEKYINNIAYILHHKYNIDFITLYSPFKEEPDCIAHLKDTRHHLYFYCFHNVSIEPLKLGLNPV